MIRYDGYYSDEPELYEDAIAGHVIKGYVHDVYHFLTNGAYLRTIRKSESPRLDFLLSDFNPDFPNKYEVKGDKLEIFFETGTQWEFSEVFEIISPEELKGKDRTLRFRELK